jgi:hypothetical protein
MSKRPNVEARILAYTSTLPFRRGIGDDLSDALVEMCWSGGHGPDRSESEKESGQLNHVRTALRLWLCRREWECV